VSKNLSCLPPFITRFTCLGLTLALPVAVNAQRLEEIQITGVRDRAVLRVEDTLVAPPDSAQLLRQLPGANVNKNGEITGIAQYRGMFGDRVNVMINGSHVSSGGPNAMDATLTYAPVALLESLTLHRGIVPVSKSQESMGGHIEADTYQGEFGEDAAFRFGGRLYAGGQSVNGGHVTSGLLTLANDRHLLRSSLMREEANDSRFAGGRIRPSAYQRERLDLGYSQRWDQQRVDIDIAVNRTGHAGTPALPMDIESFDTSLLRVAHEWQTGQFLLETRLWLNQVKHWMSNFHLRQPPQGGPSQYRRTFTTGDSHGFRFTVNQFVEEGLWRYGLDGHYALHQAEIGNPNNPGFAIDNFNDVRRNIVGVFAERERQLSENVSLLAGARVNRVSSSSGEVTANLNPMGLTTGMPVMMNQQAQILANAFNNGDLRQRDNNLDLFARLNLDTDSAITWYVGAARKSRAPSYQERFLWLPMESTAGLADGFTYTGSPDLKPEVSHELETGFDWSAQGIEFLPRVFYKRVDNFIQGVPNLDPASNRFVQMMATMGMGSGRLLAFDNVGATLYGFDMEAHLPLGGHFEARAIMSMVRGERRDISDALYRISPDNMLLAVDYRAAKWMASVESVSVRKQNRVSLTNEEEQTAGYQLFNLTMRLMPSDGWEIGLGVNNVFDRQYRDHLSGYNRAMNSDIALRERLPGLGRNFYGRVIWHY
jgi:iron complex outermembrane recepter protein